jgi:hypothetical protein
MTADTPSIRINVDPTNPGQFFACCGLLYAARCSFAAQAVWKPVMDVCWGAMSK